MKNWDDFQLILALHKVGTIRKAANLLGVNHSTVSRRLAQLAHEHKDPLFEKTPSGYKATEKGQLLVSNANDIQKIVFSSNRQLSTIGSALSGNLSLSVPDAIGQYLLVDAITDFCAMHPLINLQVSSSYDLIDLNKNQADVVVRGTDNPLEHLVGHRLFPYYLCDYGHKDYLTNTPRKALQWICKPFSGPKPEWMENSYYHDVSIGMQIADVTLRHLCLMNKKGLSRSPCYIADQYPELRRLPDSKPSAVADLWVLTHPDLRHNEKVKALMKHLNSALRAKKDLIIGNCYQH